MTIGAVLARFVDQLFPQPTHDNAEAHDLDEPIVRASIAVRRGLIAVAVILGICLGL